MFVPTHEHIAREALEIAGVGPKDLVVDLGCGDGRFLVAAAKYFDAKAVGIEIRKNLASKARERVQRLGLKDLVEVVQGDMFDFDLRSASVVTLYQLPKVNAMLRVKLEQELSPGSRVVSLDFPVPGWLPVKVKAFYDPYYQKFRRAYLYVVPSGQENLPSKISVSTPTPLVLPSLNRKRCPTYP